MLLTFIASPLQSGFEKCQVKLLSLVLVEGGMASCVCAPVSSDCGTTSCVSAKS